METMYNNISFVHPGIYFQENEHLCANIFENNKTNENEAYKVFRFCGGPTSVFDSNFSEHYPQKIPTFIISGVAVME